MELEAFFPGVWDKLTDAQRRALESAASPRRLEAGEQLSGAGECVGLLAVRSGRLRAYISNNIFCFIFIIILKFKFAYYITIFQVKVKFSIKITYYIIFYFIINIYIFRKTFNFRN